MPLVIHLARWAAGHLWSVIPAAAFATVFLLVAGHMLRRFARGVGRANRPDVAVVASVVGALMCLGLSLNTSWRFTKQDLHIHDMPERLMVVAIYETGLVALALLDRRERLHASQAVNEQSSEPVEGEEPKGPSGVPGMLLRLLAGFGIVPAFVIGGLVGGIARFVAVLLGLVLFHLAIGTEIRLRGGSIKDGPLAKIGAELRERIMARLGLGNDRRKAAEIAKDRSAVRAATLALAYDPNRHGAPRHLKRLRRMLRRADVATDPVRRKRMLDELAVARFAAELGGTKLSIPWGAIDAETTGNAGGNRDNRKVPRRPVVDNPEDNRPKTTGDNPGGNRPVVEQATPPVVDDNPQVTTDNPGDNQRDNRRVVAINGKPSRLDRTIPVVREHGSEVALSVIMQRVGCDKAAASRLRKQAAEKIAELDADDDPEREAI